MSRTLYLTGAVAAIVLGWAGVASAESIVINVGAKDAATLHREIRHAALAVCDHEFADASLSDNFAFDCVRATAQQAEADVNRVLAANGAPQAGALSTGDAAAPASALAPAAGGSQ